MMNTNRSRSGGLGRIIGIAAAILAVAGIIALFVVKNRIEAAVTAQVDERISEAADYALISYDDVSLSFTGTVTITGIAVVPLNPDGTDAAPPTAIGSVIIRDYDRSHEIPHYMDVSMNDMVTPLTSPGAEEAFTTMRALGYEDSYTSSMDIHYRYDQAAETLAVKKLAVTAEDVAAVDLRLTASSFDPSGGFLPWIIMGYTETAVESARITFTDDSILDRVMALVAAEQEMSTEEVEAMLKDELARSVELFDSPRMQDIGDAVASFIDNRSTISLALNPETPMPVGAIQRMFAARQIETLLTELNVSATNTAR